MHWRAARLLAQLPDNTLSRETELDVRVHVASCGRCRGRLRALQASEDLLRRIPPSIVPVEPSAGAYVRLAALARWSADEGLPDPDGWRLSFVGMASVVLLVCLAVSAGSWAPTITPTRSETFALGALGAVPPHHAYVATNYR